MVDDGLTGWRSTAVKNIFDSFIGDLVVKNGLEEWRELLVFLWFEQKARQGFGFEGDEAGLGDQLWIFQLGGNGGVGRETEEGGEDIKHIAP